MEGGRRWFDPPLSSPFSSSSSPSPPLLPVPRVSAEIPHSPPNKPVSQDAEVRSFVYAFSAFFLSLPQNSVEEVLSLSFTLFACRRLSQEKRNKKKNRIIMPALCTTSGALAPRNPAAAVRTARAVAQR